MKSAVARKSPGILMLIENNSFPWDRRMFHQASALQGAGYRVIVICPKDEPRSKVASFEVIQGVAVYRYPIFGQASGKLGYLLEYSWSLVCMAALSVLVWIREGFDVIHAANPPDTLFLIAWPFKLVGKKFVYDQHDLCPELYDSKFQRKGWFRQALLFLEQRSYRAADLVISTNQSYREIAQERGGIGDERSAIVRNGVDIAHFHRRASRPELKRGFAHMALYLGIMGKQDGVDRVVRAAHYLVHELGRRDVLFLMIGRGECWQDLQELSRQLKVDDVVQFTGRISDEMLLDYLSTADICLAPDPPDRMNNLSTMTKIMEYMACGNPIVSFDLVETRRSAADAALYVPGDDPRLFALAISDLLDKPEERKRMSQVGIERSIHVVGLNRSSKSLLQAYSRLLDQPPSSGELSDALVKDESREATITEDLANDPKCRHADFAEAGR